MSENNKRQVRHDVQYFQVANEIWDVKNLGTYEKLVYMYLARCGNQGSKAFPSYSTIAEKCDMSRSKAIDSVKKLEGVGLLTKRERKINPKQNKTNIYEVEKPRDVKGMPDKQGRTPSTQDTLPSTQDTPNKEIRDKELKKHTYIDPVKDTDAMSLFLELFERYTEVKHGPVERSTYKEAESELKENYNKWGNEEFIQRLREYFEDFNGDGLPKLQHFNEVAPRYFL